MMKGMVTLRRRTRTSSSTRPLCLCGSSCWVRRRERRARTKLIHQDEGTLCFEDTSKRKIPPSCSRAEDCARPPNGRRDDDVFVLLSSSNREGAQLSVAA